MEDVESIPSSATPPTKLKEILLVSHTHHDVGYTLSPRLMDSAHVDIVEHVLDLIEATPGNGPDVMRWTFEVSRPVLQFVQRHGDTGLARLAAAAESGRICITSGYLNFTQLLSTPELESALRQLNRLKAAGIRIRTQQHGDVNGLGWGTTTALQRHGTSRLVMALNPDHGHPPLPQPSVFNWEGPGGERIFTFLSTHYGFGEPWGILDARLDEAIAHLEAFAHQVDTAAHWPFDVAIMHAANDNRWPSLDYLKVVRAWNELHPELPMRTVTMDEAIDYLEASAPAADLPVLRGEWADWWAHGHGSTAREVATLRESLTFLNQARWTHSATLLRGDGCTNLATVLGYNRGPVRHHNPHELAEGMAEAESCALLSAEHTWGSWDTHEGVRGANAFNQANAKASYVWRAWELGRTLATEGFFRAIANRDQTSANPTHHPVGCGSDQTVARGDRLAVINPTPRPRTETVHVRIDNGLRETLHRVSVPGFGQVSVPLDRSKPVVEPGNIIENNRYRVELNPARGGVVSIWDKKRDMDLLDTSQYALGTLIQERLDDGKPELVHTPAAESLADDPGATLRLLADSMGPASAHRPTLTPVTGTASEGTITQLPGQVSLSWAQDLPWLAGTPAQRQSHGLSTRTLCTLTLTEGNGTIDVDFEIDKVETPYLESLHVAFPFAVEGDPEFVVDTQGAAYVAGHEQLPNTCHAWYSVQNAIGVRGSADLNGVLLTTPDAPLLQLGGIHTTSWLEETSAHFTSGLVTSWIMNNWYGTNFRSHQGGYHRFRYQITPAEITHASVRITGDNAANPLHVRQYGGPVYSPDPELVLQPDDAALISVTPDFIQERVHLTLYPLGLHDFATLSWGDSHIEVDLTGDPQDFTLQRTDTGVTFMKKELP